MLNFVVPVAFLLALGSREAAADEILVDFETFPDGTTPSELTPITDQYAGVDVLFRLKGTTAAPIIVTEGAPTAAFEAYVAKSFVYDLAVSGVNALSDGNRRYRDLAIDFTHPVSEVEVAMLDFGDCVNNVLVGEPVSVTLAAFDAAGNVVDTYEYVVGKFRPGSALDGAAVQLVVSGEDIVRVETFGARRDCGKAWDDVRFVRQDLDGDGVIDGEDLCWGDDATGGEDDDGGCDDLDPCFGDDATGDTDADAFCDHLVLCAGDDESGDTYADAICGEAAVVVTEACGCDAGWASHGAYVACVAGEAKAAFAAGEIDAKNLGELLSAAARSDCGR